MPYFACLLLIGLFTILPLIGVYIASELWNLDTSGMFAANLVHVCLIYLGAFFAIRKIKRKRLGWDTNKTIVVDSGKLFNNILKLCILFSIILFFLYGRAIFSGVYRGDVRASVGSFGWLVTFITGYAIPGLLAYATVVYCYYCEENQKQHYRIKFYLILGIGVLVGLMQGGKSSVVSTMFPAIIQYSQKLSVRNGIIIGVLGALSIILIGEKQMGQTFSESVSYNIYRATDLAGFGTACVWDKYKYGRDDAYLTVYNVFGENITSRITGIDRHSQDFLKFNIAREVTYDYYKDPEGAITGSGNLTVTSFGEAVFWLGRTFFFVISIIAALITYKLIILLFKSRNPYRLRYNTLITVYFTSVYISWLNSTTGSLLSAFLGLTTLFYMVLLYYLLKYIERNSKKKLYVKNSI